MSANGSVKNRSKDTGHRKRSSGDIHKQIEQFVPGSTVPDDNRQTTVNLLICVGGIYASFLTWGILQERITTTSYGSAASPEKFKAPIVINTVQSTLACLLGYIYLRFTRRKSSDLPVFPTTSIIFPLLLVALTSSLASPFGYASLAHVDYITFILAKSCKLLPVMALHVTLFRRKYPLYKYGVVALVTGGVAIFTLHHPSGKKKGAQNSSAWGLLLLSINLLFDGLTNSTQDHIYKAFKPYTGQQMMCGLNLLSTILTTGFLLVEPWLNTTVVGAYLGMKPGRGELEAALAFVQKYPQVGWDVLAFAACGALGQVFIFYTLSTFGSLLLVTVTVTRKMLTMILSVVWFGHKLSPMQWLGVGLVFGGVGLEAQLSKREKQAKVAALKKQK
ncbi:UAA transporter [Myriangium duriaei CBS 260.36]|uniref:UDP-galactose transporter homolog 1 n=1 Tax=Myriangium duriaei CBS 260.36 TaxID=1168546 RepID=A0A9P4MHE7_9PEZI|nr:UAA transporter [Myriangium duriaei CBS 260.36]